MKHLVTITIFLILVTLSQGCRHRVERLEPYGWTLIDPKFDSLTRIAESYMYTNVPLDSIESVVLRMDSIARNSTDNTNEKLARIHYWEAYRLRMSLEAGKADNLLAMADSLATDLYTKERINSLKVGYGNYKSYETFCNLLSQLEYYSSIGDMPEQGNTAMMISTNLTFTEVPDLALYYLNMADSLFNKSGNKRRTHNLLINKASLLCSAGKMDEADKVFNKLLSDSTVTVNKEVHELLLRNHYYFFGDSASLFNAYNIRKEIDEGTPQSKTLMMLYETLIGEYYLDKGMMHSASDYLTKSGMDPDSINDEDLKSTVYGIYAKYYEAIGDKDKAIAALKRYDEIQKTLQENQKPENKIYTEYLRAKDQLQSEALEEKTSLRMKHNATIGVSIILFMIIFVIGRKWYRRYRIKQKETLRRAEQRERELMGSTLSLQHNEQILDYVDKEITRLSNQNVISGRDIVQLDRNLHLKKLDRKEIQSFEETFTSIHPYFETNLRNIAPDLSDTQVRLCAYIMLGMNNQEIASMLNIKPSSLRQARLRLRQKFGLTKDDSITEFLKQFTPPHVSRLIFRDLAA